MKNKLLLILLMIVRFTFSMACDCPPIESFEDREKSYYVSDVVFLAQYLESNDKLETQRVKVLEVFKGELRFDTLEFKIKSNCSLFLSEGIWLLYGNYQKDSSIEVSVCGASRSLKTPMFPPFPHKSGKSFEIYNLQNEISYNNNRLIEFQELISDIELYRSRKVKNNVVINNGNYYWYFIISIFFNFVVIVLLFTKRN